MRTLIAVELQGRILVVMEAQPAPSSVSSAVLRTTKLVEGLLTLASGWDSYGAAHVDADAARAALSALVAAAYDGPDPHVVPTSAGGAQLDWETEECGIEIEFLPGGAVDVLVDNDGQMQERRLESWRDPYLAELLDQVSGR